MLGPGCCTTPASADPRLPGSTFVLVAVPLPMFSVFLHCKQQNLQPWEFHAGNLPAGIALALFSNDLFLRESQATTYHLVDSASPTAHQAQVL